jgi:glycosyltransferase involved in cell wall biosynthesis
VGFPRHTPDYLDRLKDRAKELGIADRVRIASYPGPIGDVWRAIDIQAHPSLLDSLPNAIIEGMSLGKPAVVSDIGGTTTLVGSGQTGFVVPPGCTNSLAAALLALLDDDVRAEQFGKAAQRRYESGYTPRHMAKQLERLFSQVAS